MTALYLALFPAEEARDAALKTAGLDVTLSGKGKPAGMQSEVPFILFNGTGNQALVMVSQFGALECCQPW